MGEGRRSLAPRFGFQTSEGTLSLAAEQAQPPPDRRPGRSPLAVAQRLSETGSSLMAPLFALWGPAYHAIGPLILARSRRYAE